MTGGIIMAGVPGNAWRTPTRAPQPQVVPIIPIGAAALGVGGVSTAGLTTAAGWAVVGGGALFSGYQVAKFVDTRQKTAPRQDPGPSVPGGRSGPHPETLSQYKYGRRMPSPRAKGPSTQTQPNRVPPKNPKIANPKVGCKTAPYRNPKEKDLSKDVRTRKYVPRHRGQLGDPNDYTSGAKPDRGAETYLTKEKKKYGHYAEPPAKQESPADCNPNVQQGPGRQMEP